MTERMVQVPVSLIEKLRGFAQAARDYYTVEQVEALLSQPTPSAEHKPDCDRASELSTYCDCHVEQAVLHGPESPQIEDMAPGTTFGIEFRWTVVRDPSGATFLYRDNNGYAQWLLASDGDPTTIRDVTPPS